jgi:hypothetical protein
MGHTFFRLFCFVLFLLGIFLTGHHQRESRPEWMRCFQGLHLKHHAVACDCKSLFENCPSPRPQMPTPGEASVERDHAGMRPPEGAAEQHAPSKDSQPRPPSPAVYCQEGCFFKIRTHRDGFPSTFSPLIGVFCCCCCCCFSFFFSI